MNTQDMSAPDDTNTSATVKKYFTPYGISKTSDTYPIKNASVFKTSK